jgi:hypothetical protein
MKRKKVSDMFKAEEIDGESWGIMDEGVVFTGCCVKDGMSETEAKFYQDLMNAVYNRIKKDIEAGYIKGDKV